jgi:hypothetical protein
MFYVALGAAFACNLGIFDNLATPLPGENGRGVATGEASHNGMSVVGGNFSKYSSHGTDGWKKVLKDAGTQDVWVPKQFGYELAEYIDPSHMYMAFNLSFLGDLFHVRRQLIVEVANVDTPTGFRSCWWMVDPTPYLDRIGQWKSEAEWERAMFGRWEITPQQPGRTLISYQWWTQSGKVPSAILRYAVSRTLPDLVDAFDDRVGQLGG